jgi:hypothetical protein
MFDVMKKLLEVFIQFSLWLLVIGVVSFLFVNWIGQLKNEPRSSELCHQAAACKKYSEVREECATAGNFKTCARIKMGEYANWSDICSGHIEGGPALPLPPQTPNAVECYLRTLFWG